MTACPACHYDPDATVTACWRFFIPIAGPSQNRLHGKGGARFKYRKVRDDYERMIRAAIVAHKVMLAVGPRAAKRRVTLTRFYTGREREFDRANWVGGAKPILDALVRCGLLVDDSPRWLDDYYHQRRDEHLRGVEIQIEEVQS